MAAVVKMESGAQGGDGVRTDHDRDYAKTNGVNGEPDLNAAKAAVDTKPSSAAMINGGYDSVADEVERQRKEILAAETAASGPRRLNDLPDEIQHITTGFVQLGPLVTRLAQRSHNALQEKIAELARMPIAAPAANGNTDAHNAPDDASPENVEKKRNFLRFCVTQHEDWTKALVMTEVYKRMGYVTKLIDLNHHITLEKAQYHEAMDEMITIKRDLTFARLPAPDLKTALQVLSQGTAPWMPELDYVAPPPLSPQEQLKWIENINTLLSLRLSLEDNDKIPYHFKDFAIGSGRVTFKVKGEFEVDLTIADEDFDKQLWFLDFRFLFSPAPAQLSDALRGYVESKVNDILAVEGLAGCYHFLHEFVLTHKITEIRRQANELGRGRWIDTLKVEQLNRAMAIQYWASRYPPGGSKSWVILGVRSGKRPDRVPHPRFTSRLALRWFRDGKEVKDAEIPLDDEKLSAEDIIKAVVSRHVEDILSSIHAKLRAKPRFEKRLASMRLRISAQEPMDSYLKVQLTHLDSVVMRIDPITGLFSLAPQSRATALGEHRLKSGAGAKDAAEEGLAALDMIRSGYAYDELNRRGKGYGWTGVKNNVPVDELRQITQTREAPQVVWFKRQDWDSKWQIMVSLSMGGDRWWLVEFSNNQSGPRIRTYLDLPLSSGQPNLEDPFFSDFTVWVAGIIANVADVRELKSRRRSHVVTKVRNPYLPPRTTVPAIKIRLADIVPSQAAVRSGGAGAKKHWAGEFVWLLFKGVEEPRRGDGEQAERRLGVVAEARLYVTDRTKFGLLKGKVDHDVAFNARTGQFSLNLRAEVGRSVVETLEARLRAIERVVDFLDAARSQSEDVRCTSVTLRKLAFEYGHSATASDPAADVNGGTTAGDKAGDKSPPHDAKAWAVTVDLARGADIRLQLARGNPHLRVVDYLTRVANDAATFGALPFYLSLTLPLYRALDRIDDAWTPIQRGNRGALTILPRSVDWASMRIMLPPPAAGAPPRALALDVRLCRRRGEVWWLVRRVGGPSDADAADDDDVGRALRKVWDGRGPGWRGLGTGAAARPREGIEPCLAAVDEAIRALVHKGPMAAALALHQQQQQQRNVPPKQAKPPGPSQGHAHPTSVVDLT